MKKTKNDENFTISRTHRKYGGPWKPKGRPPPATTRFETTPNVSPHITNVVSSRGYWTGVEMAKESGTGGCPSMGGGGRKKQGKKTVSALKSHISAFWTRPGGTEDTTMQSFGQGGGVRFLYTSGFEIFFEIETSCSPWSKLHEVSSCVAAFHQTLPSCFSQSSTKVAQRLVAAAPELVAFRTNTSLGKNGYSYTCVGCSCLPVWLPRSLHHASDRKANLLRDRVRVEHCCVYPPVAPSKPIERKMTVRSRYV